MSRGLLTLGVSVWSVALVCAPLCAAEPPEPGPAPDPAPTENVAGAELLADQVPADVDPLTGACSLFNAALNVAAANYEDFAYATAGNGDFVDYQDQNVVRTNLVGRTALRQAAAAALSASRTPGVPAEVSDPMRSWSLHATKLVLVMGLHGGGDTLNNSVAQLNTEGHEAQMACAQARQG